MSEENPRCPKCGLAVGVYEPATIVVDGQAYATSLAAQTGQKVDGLEVYHRDCSPGP